MTKRNNFRIFINEIDLSGTIPSVYLEKMKQLDNEVEEYQQKYFIIHDISQENIATSNMQQQLFELSKYI